MISVYRIMLALVLLQVVDLPVAVFEAYEKFSLCYFAIGRRVDAQCNRSASFKRKKESKYKEARPVMAGLTHDDSSQSSSSTSSSSSNSNSKSRSNKKDSGSDTESDEDEDDFDNSCASVDRDVMVGSLECRLFKISYVMINGDAQSQEYHEPLTQFFQDFDKITVVLCGSMKPGAGIFHIACASSFYGGCFFK